MTDEPSETFDDVGDPPKQKGLLKSGRVRLFVFFGIAFLVIALFFPLTRDVREVAHRSQCKNNLRQIGIALHEYNEKHGAFPPAHTVDAAGKRLHSWRTLILPFIDQQKLYDSIDLSKAWNDPANAKAYATEIELFRCPSGVLPAGHTSYLAVVAPNSLFQATKPRLLSDVTDKRRETLLATEVALEDAVHWMAPHDADAQMFLDMGDDGKELAHQGGVQLVFVDRHVRFFSANTPTDVRQMIISIAAGDSVEETNW